MNNQMKTRSPSRIPGCLVLLAGLAAVAPSALAHCDTLDGPVVSAARKALAETNVNLILIWVQKPDEAEIKQAFQKTLAVRKLNADAQNLADMYFFETLVRIHRAGEGEPYTGLKPAGRDLGPVIPAADKAIESGKVDSLLKLLTEALQEGVREKFKDVMAKKKFKPDDVEAGRKYVEAYVPFLHYVERIYDTTKTSTGDHSRKSDEVKMPQGERC